MADDDIRDLAERYWTGEADLVLAHHPVAPAAGARPYELAEGILYLKSIAGVTVLDTGHQLDAGTVHAGVVAWRPGTPVTAAVFSHHHVDHVFGVGLFDTDADAAGRPRPRVYAHEDLPAHFARYVRTEGWNRAINMRQFGIYAPGFRWPTEFRAPDHTYRDRLTFREGELTFELRHARGETDDATWTWVPELSLLHPGDLFIYAVPNAGNPQKVQRYLSDWAAALRQMAGLGAEVMVSGHGLPIFGADRIATALTDTAELLDSIEDQTLALMNQGKALDQILHAVEVPAHLRDKPYLRPVYDHPQFLVRNVWRRYGGWYEGEPDNLLPAPRAQQAREWVALAGGLGPVLERASLLAETGDHRMACHLVEHAVLAEPESAEAHRVRARIYAARATTYESSMARNILNHAARSSEAGRRDLAGGY
ncbi:MAG TPA: alkyl sulfatase dimerization domain-containing protein [Acidimicrobiales bacterium]|nr:alkyl sulfatase dimerization domain-containing protein [Acidimicrobiales bacterium]